MKGDTDTSFGECIFCEDKMGKTTNHPERILYSWERQAQNRQAKGKDFGDFVEFFGGKKKGEM